MADLMKNFIIPILQLVVIGIITTPICYFVGKAVWNVWSKKLKFFFKYTLFRRPYPESSVKWVMDCIDNGVGWYDVKKIMMVKMMPQSKINETLWIYDKILNELNKQMKGGNKNGREFKRCYSKTKGTATGDFPDISTYFATN